MPLSGRFTTAQLQAIIEQGAIYMCACPAQVCQQMLSLRELYAYQEECQGRDGNAQVHQAIAAATARAYAELEDCLDRILDMEGWDRVTLTMPAGLRALRDKALEL